jgi:hypothetical protein
MEANETELINEEEFEKIVNAIIKGHAPNGLSDEELIEITHKVCGWVTFLKIKEGFYKMLLNGELNIAGWKDKDLEPDFQPNLDNL